MGKYSAEIEDRWYEHNAHDNDIEMIQGLITHGHKVLATMPRTEQAWEFSRWLLAGAQATQGLAALVKAEGEALWLEMRLYKQSVEEKEHDE